MSLRELVETDCGGQNPLLQLGAQVSRDVTFRDDGISRPNALLQGDQIARDFLQQMQPPPQTFQLNDIMREIQQMENQSAQVDINGADWAKEYDGVAVPMGLQAIPSSSISRMPVAMQLERPMLGSSLMGAGGSMMQAQPKVTWTKDFFDAEEKVEEIEKSQGDDIQEWVKAFEEGKDAEEQASGLYNRQFWEKLQNEWRRISEETEEESPFFDYSSIYDPYKEYKYSEENPMIDAENALEKGKTFLAQGDIPSAVLCFEAATKQSPENVEVWELLGTTQAENENDPNAIPALKKALELQPNNLNVLMSLAVCYTNESYQREALRHLKNWLASNPKYSHLVPQQEPPEEGAASLTSSIIRGNSLQEVQELFLKAVHQNIKEVDPDVQEALGVLFNLSQDYEKAVDCFQAAVSVRSDNAKTWNRLGASLANGNRNVEAVAAYQNALALEPGFIRARYNVGIICINLKSYKEACEHLLTALNHQASSTSRAGINSAQQMSDSIWNTLRMAVSLAGRRELQEAIEKRDLDALNAAFNSEGV